LGFNVTAVALISLEFLDGAVLYAKWLKAIPGFPIWETISRDTHPTVRGEIFHLAQ
jgi:hypothetical protein